MQLGKTKLHIVSDGIFWNDGGGAFGLVPRPLWEKVVTPDARNRIPMHLNCLLIESEGRRILVDTGYGDKLSPKERAIFDLAGEGRLLGSLAALGLQPADIDVVLHTHLHVDHCGGSTRREGDEIVPTFPRADHGVQRLELADALFPNERTQATYRAENLQPLERNGQLHVLNGDTRITSEVRTLTTPGHTRAHQSIVIESGGRSAIYLGDLAPLHVHMERLAWIPAFDTEPLETLETKRRIARWAVETQALLIFDHAPQPFGYLIEEKPGTYRVTPAEP